MPNNNSETYLRVLVTDKAIREAIASAFNGKNRAGIRDVQKSLVERVGFDPTSIVTQEKMEREKAVSGYEQAHECRYYKINGDTVRYSIF